MPDAFQWQLKTKVRKKKRHRLTKIKRIGEEIIGVYKKTLLEEMIIYLMDE